MKGIYSNSNTSRHNEYDEMCSLLENHPEIWDESIDHINRRLASQPWNTLYLEWANLLKKYSCPDFLKILQNRELRNLITVNIGQFIDVNPFSLTYKRKSQLLAKNTLDMSKFEYLK